MKTPPWLTARPFAHRGLHDRGIGRVENTLPAVEAAMKINYGVEVDLQLSDDNEVMVFHDSILERLTLGRGPLRGLSRRELQKLKLRESDATIPSLAELLDHVDGDVPLLLEMKSENAPKGILESRTARLLHAYKGQFAVMAFSASTVAWFLHHAPMFVRGQLARGYREGSKTFASRAERFARRHVLTAFEGRPHFIGYEVRALPRAAGVHVARALGLPVLAWTVRNEEDRKIASQYADNIIFENFLP
jgi:glycerophosphoryl diester phosphodiesterase